MVAEVTTYIGTRLATDVKNKFGDVGSVQITDPMIVQWINDGVRSIVAANPFLKLTAQTNVLAGQSLYEFSTAFPTARIVQFDSITYKGRALKVVPFQQFQQLIAAAVDDTRTGEPTMVTEYGGDLTLWPTPTETTANALVIYYSAYPQDLVNLTELLPVPDRFYNALLDFVYAQALQLDENFEAAEMKLGHHEAAMRRQFGKEDVSPTDFYPTITELPDEYQQAAYRTEWV